MEPARVQPPSPPPPAAPPADRRTSSRAPSKRTRDRFVSVGVQLTLATVLVLSAVSAFVGIQLTRREHEQIVGAKKQSAKVLVDLLAAELVAPLDFNDMEGAATELEHLRGNRDVIDAVVFRGLGTPFAWLGGTLDASPHAMIDKLHPSTLRDDQMTESRDIMGPDGRRLGGVFLTLSLAPENDLYLRERKRILVATLLLTAATAALLIIIARRQIVRPLDRLMDAAQRIERGERNVLVDVDHGVGGVLPARDEIDHLGALFNAMSASIVEREDGLATATRSLQELFDHMRQAIVVFGVGGVVDGAPSRAARSIFGEVAPNANVVELLFPGDLQQSVEGQAFDEWVRLAFDVPRDDWSEIAELAPREVRLPRGPNDDDALLLVLEHRPIFQGTRLVRVMLLASDETENRRLKLAVRTQDEEHARQLSAMRRLVSGGGQVFVRFVEGTKDRLDRCEAMLSADDASIARSGLDEIFQHIHTLKGEARAYDLPDLEAQAATLEDELGRMRDRSLRASRVGVGVSAGARVPYEGDEATRWLEHVRRARDAVTRAQAMFVEASPIGAAILDQITVSRADVEELARAVQHRVDGRDDVVARLAKRLVSRRFGEIVAPLAESAPDWAAHVGSHVRVDVRGVDVRVPPRLASVLSTVLTHLIRNAVAHGIESPGQREAAGKDPIGVIGVRCDAHGDDAVVTVEDDGRGIDGTRLLANARERGVDVGGAGATAEDAIALAFRDGVTTKSGADRLSGRGVGLAAVRAAVASIGYRIEVHSERNVGARFVVHRDVASEPPPRGPMSREPMTREGKLEER